MQFIENNVKETSSKFRIHWCNFHFYTQTRTFIKMHLNRSRISCSYSSTNYHAKIHCPHDQGIFVYSFTWRETFSQTFFCIKHGQHTFEPIFLQNEKRNINAKRLAVKLGVERNTWLKLSVELQLNNLIHLTDVLRDIFQKVVK